MQLRPLLAKLWCGLRGQALAEIIPRSYCMPTKRHQACFSWMIGGFRGCEVPRCCDVLWRRQARSVYRPRGIYKPRILQAQNSSYAVVMFSFLLL